MIRNNGYEAEIHHVKTQDGFILTVFRCYSKATNKTEDTQSAVVVAHGLTLSSDHYVIGQPNQTLGDLAFFITSTEMDI